MQISMNGSTWDKPNHLPDWLYNALPYLYALVGLTTMITLHSGMALFSGLTLISAGAYIWMLRYRYRREHRPSRIGKALPEKKEDDCATEGNFVQVAWRKSFECGHALIDAQHRKLFDIGNDLINAVLNWKPKSEVEWLMDTLVEHITEHFCTEEAILARTKNPLSREHQEVHRQLLAKAQSLRARYHADEVVVGELVGFLAYDVVTQHIIKEDLKFAV